MKRHREDSISTRLLDKLDGWLKESNVEELALWSHAFLAHAGSSENRKKLPEIVVTLDKITNAIKELALITEAISNWLLWSGGLANNLVPYTQFDQFEKLDKPIMDVAKLEDAELVWKFLSDERNKFLDPLDELLFGKP